MKLTRFTSPFDLGRVADFDQWLRQPLSTFPGVGQFLNEILPGTVSSRLATDVHEDQNNFYALFELPGVKKEDVKVEVHDRLLTVSAERREKKDETEQSFTVSRSVTVPEGIKGDAINAKLEDGVLTITLPKQAPRQPRSIEVS